jgi:hypothetical protein
VDTTKQQVRSRARSVWLTSPLGLGLFALLLLGLGGGLLLAVRSSNSMTGSTSSTTERQVVAARTGTQLSMVVEIRSAPAADVLVGRLLTKAGDTAYRRTARTVGIRWGSATRVVMGQKGDVYQGAILQVQARALSHGWFLARQITVLNGFVTVR